MKPATARAESSAGNIVAAALDYAARGWAVIPLRPATKNPGREEWQLERYPAEKIPAAFAHAGGIGILNGEPSGGLRDVDADEAAAAAAWQHYRLETNRRHRRASGYTHDWYVVEAPSKTEQFRDPVDQSMLIELRSTGSHTCVPPSRHPSGEQLAWIADGEPAHVKGADLQRAVRHAAAAALLARHYPGEGSRHDYRLALAGCLLRGGFTAEAAELLMTVSARIAGADEHDAAAAVRDTAATIADGKPSTGTPRLADLLGRDGREIIARLRQWLELRSVDVLDDDPPLDLWGSHLAGLPPLDLATLPGVLAELAADVSERHGCDPALVALPALGVCAGAIDDRHQLQPRQHDAEWRVAARLWVAPLADVGGGKSPALAVAYRPLRAIDDNWASEDAGPLRRYALALRAYNKTVDKYVNAGAVGDAPAEPSRPPSRRRVCEDITPEALSDVLADNHGGVALLLDELAAWIGSMDAYRPSGVTKDQPLYLQLYDGGPRLVERVKRGSIRVPNWGASIVGAIQPERLRQLAGKILDDGLFARMIPYVARDAVDPIDRPANRDALARYGATIARLVDLPPRGVTYTLSPAAHLRREYVARIARAVMALPTTSSALRGHLAKWEGLYARVLLTWHLTDATSRGERPDTMIGEDAADRVARLMVGYCLPHSAHVYGELLGQDHLTHARWLAGHILAHGLDRLSAREIGRAYYGFRDDRRGLDDAMETLTVAGWVAAIDPKPGRPATRWRINPRVHVEFAARAATEQQRREAAVERLLAARELLGLDAETGT